MTIGTLKMPRMGETMEEGKLVGWLVEPGQSFKRGQDILEVETDKTIVEFPALGDGTVVETLVEIGEMVSVGTPIARVDVGEGPDWTGEGSSGEAAEKPEAESAPGSAAAVAEPAAAGNRAPGGAGRIRATPLARRVARQRGLDLAGLAGSGRRGRIERRDVEATGATPGAVQQVAGVTWNETGPASGDCVMLLHGFAGDHVVWNGVQTRLSQAGRRTISVDLPGHGSTRHDADGPEDLTDPVERAMSERSLGPLHLVAHSMGAIPAVRLALSRGAKSLTLLAPAGLGHVIDAEFLRGLARARTAGEVSHLLGRVAEGPLGLSSAMLAQIHAEIARGRLTALADSLVGGSGQAVSIRAELAELAERMPVHLILGHRDRILDWREALDVSPRISIHHLPRAGHSPHWEALADVAAILTDITK